MRFLILGRSVGLKKKKTKRNHKKSRNRRPWYPRTTLKVNIHIFGLTKYTIYCKKFSCFCFCFSLCCYYKYSFFSLQQFFQLKNGLTTSSFLLFLKMAKSWVGRTTVNGEKKRGWANYKKKQEKEFDKFGLKMQNRWRENIHARAQLWRENTQIE